MNETRPADSSQSHAENSNAYGQLLLDARKRRDFTIEEVAKSVNLPVDIIKAIENSDNARLPKPAFVQGYLRSYARYVGVSDKQILDEYSKAVPHAREAELKPRTSVYKETNSHTPVVRIVSSFLVIAGLAAMGYGIYSYYSEKADSMELANTELEKNISSSTESYVLPVETKMDNSLSEEPGPIEGGPVNDEGIVAREELTEEVEDEIPIAESIQPVEEERITDQSENAFALEAVDELQVQTQPIAPGNDEIKLLSLSDSWIEITDANGVIMYYNLMPGGQTAMLRGTAPFDVFMGNAPAMRVVINDVDIDVTDFIRSNNIAHLKVAVDDGQVIFSD